MKFHEGVLTQKNRVAIESEQVPDLLRGEDGARRVIARIAATQSPGRAASTARFLETDAFAVVCTNYRRLSYSGTDIRITFDRDIEYHPVPAPGAPTLRTSLGMPAAVEERAVMEVKMTSMARPGWLARLLDAIEPEAFSKFVRAVTLVLPNRAQAATTRLRGG